MRGRLDTIGTALALGTLGVAVWTGCSEEAPSARPSAVTEASTSGDVDGGETPSASGDAESQADRIAAGRAVYNANCIACHSVDPGQDGALGPGVAGASLELLEARVLRAEYPPGYEPKRKTRVMVALPHLERQLPDLAAYLQSVE